ncbi:MAG: head-tail adaptor protein [Mangrovicoccus sp.]|nr:head-tail adaptor protein [Mangrovicoccus sp.]
MTVPDPRTAFTLEGVQETPDGAGSVREAWVALGIVWGELRGGNGNEGLQGEVGVARSNYSILVRGAPHGAPSRPTVRQRLRRGSRVFRVVSVTEADPAGRFLVCRVVEEQTA